jgi:hypothetical protein
MKNAGLLKLKNIKNKIIHIVFGLVFLLAASPTMAAPFVCGDSVTFNYRGSAVTYGTVGSSNECWMDRNLGALQVATVYNDIGARGDYFQWGRLDDGHQNVGSNTTSTLSASSVPGHNNFIDASASGGGTNWFVSPDLTLW